MDPNNIMNPIRDTETNHIATIQLNQIEDWNKWHNLHRHTVDRYRYRKWWRCWWLQEAGSGLKMWCVKEDQIQEWKVHRQSVPYALFRMCGERSLIQVWNGRTYCSVRCERSLSTYCSVTVPLSFWRSVRQSKHGWMSSGWHAKYGPRRYVRCLTEYHRKVLLLRSKPAFPSSGILSVIKVLKLRSPIIKILKLRSPVLKKS
jgi:hypothetical protein